MRESYYKYTDIETAKLVLENQSFRYSSPLKFNDPFDIQGEIKPDFDLSSLPKLAMSFIEYLIKTNVPIPNPKGGFGEGILTLREGVKRQGYKKSQIEQITYPLLGHMISEVENAIEGLNRQREISLRESRVFCVTEDNDNLLMWAHYAREHTGVVFQLRTLEQEDNILSAARKVKYEDRPSSFISSDELLNWLVLEIEPDFTKFLYSNHAHRKSCHWKYEKEWRVVDMCRYENKTDLYVDHRFPSHQLAGVFFGCKSEPDKAQEIIGLARSINPMVTLHKAKKKDFEYALEFENITNC
ncbi:DUF2971 domain-containing protein [Vibrio alginolyticus]|nr:DUF2971 domain-containing protein [Vibrio alginolyticus]